MIILIGLSLSVSRKKGCGGSRCEIYNPNIEKSNPQEKSNPLEKFKDGIKHTLDKIQLTNYISVFDKKFYSEILEIFKSFEKKPQEGMLKLKDYLKEYITKSFRPLLDMGEEHFKKIELLIKKFLKSETNSKDKFELYYDLCNNALKNKNYYIAGVYFAKLFVIYLDMI